MQFNIISEKTSTNLLLFLIHTQYCKISSDKKGYSLIKFSLIKFSWIKMKQTKISDKTNNNYFLSKPIRVKTNIIKGKDTRKLHESKWSIYLCQKSHRTVKLQTKMHRTVKLDGTWNWEREEITNLKLRRTVKLDGERWRPWNCTEPWNEKERAMETRDPSMDLKDRERDMKFMGFHVRDLGFQ